MKLTKLFICLLLFVSTNVGVSNSMVAPDPGYGLPDVDSPAYEGPSEQPFEFEENPFVDGGSEGDTYKMGITFD
ncbi:MAG: hypothetical protein N4A44_04825 [Alphaproteobacteria bacterium]|jgi:hypothetical protein|nr:hypothetical protein [Alphaproteobacteria bacterium]